MSLRIEMTLPNKSEEMSLEVLSFLKSAEQFSIHHKS